MRSHRVRWLGSSALAAAIVLLPAATATVRAQPGFGPDPFWPYNNQYAPYTTPMGPAGPDGGLGGTMNARDGLRNSNQFQNYLDSLQGSPGRNVSDRSNIGMPYYRSAVDPSFETKGRGLRQYQPNLRSTERFEDSQRRVADTYFQYYSERDPSRRAALLKDYRLARRDAALALSGRGRPTSRLLDSPAPTEPASRRAGRSGSAASRAATEDRSRDETDRFGPAPEVPTFGSRRSSSPAPRRSTSSLPSDVLNRSRAMDRETGTLPSPGSPSIPSARPRTRGTRRPASTPPATDPNDR